MGIDNLNAEEMKPLKKQDKDLTESQENFFDTMNTINTQIDTVQENVEEVKKLQRKILNAAHKSEAEHARLNDIYATTFKLAQNIRKLIAEEQDYVDKKLNPKKTTSPLKINKKLTARQLTDLRVRKTQLDGQSTRMYNIWGDYNQVQVQFREQSKKLFVRQCKVMGNSSLSNEEMEQMIDEGKNVFATSILDQERMIDNIESHVQKAEIDVEQGKGHLAKAKEYMASARKKKIILFAIIFIIVLIVLLVILAEFGAFSSSSSNNSGYPTTTTTTTSTTVSTTSFSIPNIPNGKTEPPIIVPETQP